MPNYKSSFALAMSLMASSPVIAEVRGLYGSDCMQAQGLSAKKDLFFQNQSMENVQTVYADETCAMPVYDFSFVGNFSLDENGRSLDYLYSSIKLRALDARVAEAFNQVALCGYSDWTVNSSREVAGKDCGGQKIPEPGTAVYDLVHESEDQASIQLGRTSENLDGRSTEARPDELDTLIYTAK
ncbi:MAG: hypothetical protein H7318_20275 [Oligoflexus sp.]|nr:hypothetical protein [Oligoflexus sp.]